MYTRFEGQFCSSSFDHLWHIPCHRQKREKENERFEQHFRTMIIFDERISLYQLLVTTYQAKNNEYGHMERYSISEKADKLLRPIYR